MLPHRFVVVEGNIGAGKTTFVRNAGIFYRIEPVYEQFKENPFLPKFYANPERYAFPLELSFLAERYQQLRNEVLPNLSGNKTVLCDYYLLKSLIFARFTLKDEELTLYQQMFSIMASQLPKPDLYIYLNRPIEKLLEQIKKRGRSYELDIKADYLLKVQQSYFKLIDEQSQFPIVVVELGNKDFENNPEQFQELLGLLSQQFVCGRTTVNL